MQIAAFAKRDQLVHQRLELLRLRQRGGDLLMFDQRSSHIAEHGATMRARLVQFAAGIAVTHILLSSILVWRAEISTDPAASSPFPRYFPAASWEHACQDAGPSATGLP